MSQACKCCGAEFCSDVDLCASLLRNSANAKAAAEREATAAEAMKSQRAADIAQGLYYSMQPSGDFSALARGFRALLAQLNDAQALNTELQFAVLHHTGHLDPATGTFDSCANSTAADAIDWLVEHGHLIQVGQRLGRRVFAMTPIPTGITPS